MGSVWVGMDKLKLLEDPVLISLVNRVEQAKGQGRDVDGAMRDVAKEKLAEAIEANRLYHTLSDATGAQLAAVELRQHVYWNVVAQVAVLVIGLILTIVSLVKQDNVVS